MQAQPINNVSLEGSSPAPVKSPWAQSALPGTPPKSLPLPDFAVETPCFVVLEDAVLHNLRETARHAGGVHRLMPHIKTHRAPWLIELMLKEGVRAFKAATPAEVEIAAAAGADYIVWLIQQSMRNRSPKSRVPLAPTLKLESSSLVELA